MKNKKQRSFQGISIRQIAMWIGVFLLALLLFNKSGVKETTLDYSDFKQKVATAEVANLTVAPGVITGAYKN